ncbi:amino acid racemase [Antarcticibacterium flavum]|uniref:Amino acid racemase n=1 Tax=Antarcticibacterium flavum TaxID=2058175 RepID=A0A5B7X1H9_9FLAO|nr:MULTISPECIES: amino acid racemase [Antarcticibacterium]MCM4158618.1 aspartate racemase [Antarcticibacterium sp. W02-3]QCY68473.1 amino acid racemase [Antarcticibacterium flavum]
MRKIGLIGGTSWHSTIVYYRLINEMTGEKIGNQANPELLIYSLNVELMREHNIEKINNKYLEIAQTLQEAGAKAILICANTPHLVYDFVQPKIDIPILHIADAIGKEAKKEGLKKLGLLGTRPTMTGDFISSPLKEKYGIETIIPESEYIDENHDYIAKELTKGVFSEEAKKFYLEQMRLLRARGADGIILGCTELPMLLEQKDFDLPLLATTNLHAQMASDFILEKT